MAVWGLEWIIIAVIVIVLLIWGPEKIPKIAKAFGQAKKEFDKASKETDRAQQVESPQRVVEVKSTPNDDKLLEVAAVLGISTEGKTREQIAEEVSKKLR
ncbi:MAG: twin-arginine translocase TatA/TatE family subunit [Aigarchaeota archaeon]|nr:twin-arginine translocase TatA/TatE family subunit [Aigarchaeota archaeon]MDW8092600.1 twin-arginine translocase TatA/TatE family subunit [Nitrososphaerota archaeon]